MSGTGLRHQGPPMQWAMRSKPTTWHLCRLKDVADINLASLPETTDPAFSFTYVDIGSVDEDGRVRDGEEITFGSAPSRARRLVRGGDSIVSTVRTYLKAIAYIDGGSANLVVSTGFATLTPRPGVHPRYLYWWLRGSAFVEEIVARSVGVSYPAVNASDVGDVAIHLPPIDEQRRIADILDTETARFDELLGELNHLRLLAAEHVSAKREWLFEASRAHARPLTAFLQQQPTYGVLVPRFEDDGVPFVRVGDIPAAARGELPLRFISEEQSREYRRTVLAEGDVMVSVVGSLTHSAVVPRSLVDANVARAVCVLRPAPGVPADLVSQFVQTRLYQDQARLATGSDTAQPTLNMSDLRKFAIPLPLGNEERMSMVRELKSVESHATQLLLELDRQSLFLREHRQALITAAVTGGLDAARKVA